MYKVKVSLCEQDTGINRQLPSSGFEWKNYRFYINEQIEEADFWVVCYQKVPFGKETCFVAPENTLFITWEPDSVYHFSSGFLNQFGKIISCQKYLKHKNLEYDQPGLAWHIGKVRQNNKTHFTQTYDSLSATSPKKTKLMSVICSNRAISSGHRARINFVMKLKEIFGDDLDVFGRGFCDFLDKWDVISPYKYHIAIENCSSPYYWSEKLADTYLGDAFPFYYGCTNVHEYFNSNSLKIIDIYDIEKSVEIIKNAINQNYYEKYLQEIVNAKDMVLNRYNFFDLAVRNFEKMNPLAPKKQHTIKNDICFIDLKKIPLYSTRAFNLLKYKFFA